MGCSQELSQIELDSQRRSILLLLQMNSSVLYHCKVFITDDIYLKLTEAPVNSHFMTGWLCIHIKYILVDFELFYILKQF